jgi:AcrR family transcriptional regulator
VNALAVVDPRIQRTRWLVLDTVADLMQQDGVGAVTHQRVAERAGVARATLYRHWPRPVDLVFDALDLIDEPLLRHGDLPLRSWLLSELRRVAVELAQPLAVQFLAVLIGGTALDERAAALRERLIERNVSPLADAVAAAVAAGELRTAPDPYELLAQILGPVVFRAVLHGADVDDAFLVRTIDIALAPWS